MSEPTLDPDVARLLAEAIEQTGAHGEIHLVLHEKRIVQVETTRRTKIDQPPPKR